MGTTWHFQNLNCIYTCIDQCGSIRLNIRHETIGRFNWNLIVDDRARWGVARGRWRLREIIPHKFRWDRVMLRKPPVSQSVLPGMSTKTSQDIIDLTLDKLYIGYNWLVGPLWICIPPMVLEINGSQRRNRLFLFSYPQICLTHWGLVTHICVS